MKKLILLMIVVSSVNQLFGQIQKGKVLLTGNVFYAANGDADDSYKLGLGAGYFVSDKSAIGASFLFGKSYELNLDFLYAGEIETTGFSIFSRHYTALGDENKFYFFVQPSFSSSKIKLVDDDMEIDSKILAVSPGFSFYPSSKVAIELSLTGLTYQIGEDGMDDQFTINLNPLSPTLGISFLLGGTNE